MSVLARKIARAKWETKSELGSGEIAADAVTADLKTTGNTLSFWRCESSSEDDCKRAVLALAAAAERPDRLDVTTTRKQVVDLVAQAVKDGLVNVADLKDKMKEEVETKLKQEVQKP